MKQEYAFITRNVKQVILIWQKGSTVLQMALYLQSTGGQQWINIQFISQTYNEIRNLINYKYFYRINCMPSIQMAQDFRKTLDIDDWEMVKILGGMVNSFFPF